MIPPLFGGFLLTLCVGVLGCLYGFIVKIKGNEMSGKYDKAMFAVYMTRDAHARFFAVCDEKLFRKVVSSNIQHNMKMRHITQYGYNYMVEVPAEYKDKLVAVVKSDAQISAGASENPKKDQTNKKSQDNRSKQKHTGGRLMGVKPVSAKPKSTKSVPAVSATRVVRMPLNLNNRGGNTASGQEYGYKIQDLTPAMVVEILGQSWDVLNWKHFYYSENNEQTSQLYEQELQDIQEVINGRLKKYGKKVVFVACAGADNWGGRYMENPPLFNPSSYNPGMTGVGDGFYYYGTFITYNTRTRQFEKYPRGWVEVCYDANWFDFYHKVSSQANDIFAVYADARQKRK